MDVRVLDWSDSGVRLLMPLDLAAHRHDLLDLTAWESNLWPIKGKKVQMRGRVVRVARHGDCPHCEVGLRFLSPIREKAERIFDFQWLRNMAASVAVTPCA